MSNATRSRVLAGYKRLLGARNIVFKDDARALKESSIKLRGEFEKNRHETKVEAIGAIIMIHIRKIRNVPHRKTVESH